MNLDLAQSLETDIEEALAQGNLDQARQLAQAYRAQSPPLSPREDPRRSQQLRALWLSAQVAVAEGELHQAQRFLTELRPLCSSLLDPLATRIALLRAEVEARLGHPAQARTILETLHREIIRSKTLLELRYLRLRLLLGELSSLSSELTACQQRLQTEGDLPHLALLYTEIGRAFEAHNDLTRAEQYWRQAEQWTHGQVSPIRADVLLHLGQFEHLRGQWQRALDHYDHALECTSLPAQRQEITLRRLLVLLDLQQSAQAHIEWQRLERVWSTRPLVDELRPLARMVRAVLHGVEDPFASSEVDAYQAATGGDLEQARQRYRAALHEQLAPVRRARLALALGMLGLAANDPREAKRWLSTAEQLAHEQNLPEVLWRAWQAQGQLAAQFEQDDERARALFEQAILLSESQTQQLRHRLDAVTHGLKREMLLRALLQAACRRADPEAVFRYQELERGRLLLELAHCSSPAKGGLADLPAWKELEQRLQSLETETDPQTSDGGQTWLAHRQELLLERDRLLDQYLRDRSRADHANLPRLADLSDLQRSLNPFEIYLAPAIVGQEVYFLIVRPGTKAEVVRAASSASQMQQMVAEFQRCRDEQLERYRRGFPLQTEARQQLDDRLQTLGEKALGDILSRLFDGQQQPPRRILWVPEGIFHGIPLHALRFRGHYLLESLTVCYSLGGSLFVRQRRSRPRRYWFPRALIVAESPEVLPGASREAEGVAATFWHATLLRGAQASRANLRRCLPRVQVAHFACHAYFDPQRPLAAAIGLPSGETWQAVEFLHEPLQDLPLVTLSACRSAEVAPLHGREMFGLLGGLLGAGVRTVLAGLWPIADRETISFMWRFYRQRARHPLAEALGEAQRQTLREADASPLFWGAFALFGDPDPLPPPGPWIRWLTQWLQHGHEERFPLSAQEVD